MNQRLKKLVLSALMMAFTCVATLAIRIPTPGGFGYIHPGDALVILSGVILGPGYGFLAAGIGSALADLFGGYMVYVPITFVIKGLVALIAGILYRSIKGNKKSHYLAVALAGLFDILLVTGGYYICEIPLYGSIAAAASVPANIVQGVGGLVISLLLYPVLFSIPDIKSMK